MYSWLKAEGIGKRPMRSVAAHSLRGVGVVRRCRVQAWAQIEEWRGEGERQGLARGMARIEEGNDMREEARFCHSMSKCPNAV
jgi:hypothetical protein